MELVVTHRVPYRLLFLWRLLFCRHGWHAWDEVWSPPYEHYLHCDACERIYALHP